MMGSIGFTAQTGGVAQRALVQDFYFTPALVFSNAPGSTYTLTTRSPNSNGGCDNPPSTSPVYENWSTNGFTTWIDPFADPTYALAIRNWTIVGVDIMTTKDFTTSSSNGSHTSNVSTHMALFHKPAP